MNNNHKINAVRGGSRGVAGVATPPNDVEQPLPLIYKAYNSLAQ